MREITSEGEFFTNIAKYPPSVIAIDIGGTNTRVAVIPYPPVKTFPPIYYKFKVSDVASLKSLLEGVVLRAPQLKVLGSCLAAPGPVQHNVVGPIANFKGDKRVFTLEELTPVLFDPKRSAALNDLESVGHGVLTLAGAGRLGKYFEVLMPSQNRPESNDLKTLQGGNYVVIAPGTGLGACVVFFDPVRRTRGVLPLEFGHSTVHHRAWEVYGDVLGYMQKITKRPLEWDDVVSGRGLEAMYKCYKGLPSENAGRTAASIATRGVKNECSTCRRSLLTYFELLFFFASELTISFVPAGIIIAGDNIVNNKEFLKNPDVFECCKRAYYSHPTERFKFMSNAVVISQSVETNVNLIGCEGVAKSLTAASPAVSKL